MFLIGFVTGCAATYVVCWLLLRSMRADERWWQENEGRRNSRWPVLPPEAER